MKIIKTSSTQITPEQGQIVNARQESSVNTYSCNYINSLKTEEVYSTDEQVIGKWIDGKTLYRKVIKRENISLSSSTILSNSVMADLNEITKIDVVGKKGNDYNLIAKAHPTTLNWSIGAYYNSNGWYIEAGSSAAGTWAFITIIVEYTKTTD